MEKFKYSKFEQIFKSMKILVHPEIYSKTYSKLNTFATASLYLNRVQKVSLPYEKIIFQGSFKDFSNNKAMNYFGLYKNKEEDLFVFLIETDSFKSASELIECVNHKISKNDESVVEYEDVSFRMKYSNFNARRASKAKSEMFSIMNKFNSVIPYDRDENKNSADYKKKKKAYNEYLYFKHRYIAKFLTGGRPDDYLSFIYESRDSELLKIEKNMFSQHRNQSYKKILDKTKEFSIDEIKDFYKAYPLLITLFLDYNERFPPKEIEISNIFKNSKNKDLSFIENLKTHFKLSDDDIKEIGKLSWQKNLILKNRPITLIEMIKNKMVVSNAANRRESLSCYVAHYYFKNKIYFEQIKNHDDFIKINISRADYAMLRNDIENKFTKMEVALNSLGLGINNFSSLRGKDILNTVLRNRYINENYPFLKRKVVSKGVVFKASKTTTGVYIESECEKYKAYLNIKMLNNDEFIFDWKNEHNEHQDHTGLMKEIKEDFEESIALEFSRLGNKRYPTSRFISMPFFFSYLIQYHKRRDLNKKGYFFFTSLSRGFAKIEKNDLISPIYNEKESEFDLLNII